LDAIKTINLTKKYKDHKTATKKLLPLSMTKKAIKPKKQTSRETVFHILTMTMVISLLLPMHSAIQEKRNTAVPIRLWSC